MEIEYGFVMFLNRGEINIVKQRDGSFGFVDDHYPGCSIKRHRNVAVKGSPFRVGEEFAFKGYPSSQPYSKKITQRSRYGGGPGANPKKFQGNGRGHDRRNTLCGK